MDRWAVSESQDFFRQQFDFPIFKMSEILDRLATIQVKKVVETTVRFSNLENC